MASTRVAEPTSDAPAVVLPVAEVQAPAPVIAQPATVSARVKGTWTFIYGQYRFDFVDRQRYELPREVFNYLRKHGNIYDTL